MPRFRFVLLLALAGLAGGCASRGPADNLVAQRLGWFDYISGEDIEARCRPGQPPRYRLVYNANFERQARGYDMVYPADGGPVLRQTVDRGVVLAGFHPFELFSLGAPRHAETPLTDAEVAEFEALLEASGAFEPPPVGLRLNSRRFYWLVMGCRDGEFFLTAYRHPSERFDRIQFVDFLAERDRTGVPIPAPRWGTDPLEIQRCSRQDTEGRTCFLVIVGENGLTGF